MNRLSFTTLGFLTIFWTAGCGVPRQNTKVGNTPETPSGGFIALSSGLAQQLQGRSYYLTQAGYTCQPIIFGSSRINSYVDKIEINNYETLANGQVFLDSRFGDKCNDTIERIDGSKVKISADFTQLVVDNRVYQFSSQEP